MSYPCRCSDCRGRRSLKHKPNWYVSPPRCANCGNNKWVLDTYRMKNPDKDRGGAVCTLDCLPYPHRVNTKGCRHYEDDRLEKVLGGSDAGLTDPDEPIGF